METNPYDAPRERSDETPRAQSDHANGTSTLSGCLTFGIASSIVAGVYLLQYIALIYIHIRILPIPKIISPFWDIILFLTVPAFVLAAFSLTGIVRMNIGTAFTAWLCGLILAIPLCFTVGVWFILAIGG